MALRSTTIGLQSERDAPNAACCPRSFSYDARFYSRACHRSVYFVDVAIDRIM